MLTTDTALELGTYSATALYSHLNKLTYTVLVEYLEGASKWQFLLTYSLKNGKISMHRYAIIDMGAGRHLCLKCGASNIISFRG